MIVWFLQTLFLYPPSKIYFLFLIEGYIVAKTNEYSIGKLYLRRSKNLRYRNFLRRRNYTDDLRPNKIYYIFFEVESSRYKNIIYS
jgi:hypothetical protein